MILWGFDFLRRVMAFEECMRVLMCIGEGVLTNHWWMCTGRLHTKK